MTFVIRLLDPESSSAPMTYHDPKVVRAVLAWLDAEAIDWEVIGDSGKVDCTSRAILTERTAFFASLEVERGGSNGT